MFVFWEAKPWIGDDKRFIQSTSPIAQLGMQPLTASRCLEMEETVFLRALQVVFFYVFFFFNGITWDIIGFFFLMGYYGISWDIIWDIMGYNMGYNMGYYGI